MEDSAQGLRGRRRAETVRSLIALARRATAEAGLSGFTIEGLCEQAGVSRRTFFNYFASKEDAVIGLPLEHGANEAEAEFLAGASETKGISPTLLTDLARLSLTRWRALELSPDTVGALVAAVDREPRLLGRILELGLRAEQADARLVERREGLPEGDLRAEAAAMLVGAISRAASAEFLDPANSAPFSLLFARRLAAAHELFTATLPPEGLT